MQATEWTEAEQRRMAELDQHVAASMLAWTRLRQSQPLPAYAWPGGYTIIYYTSDGDPLCADCAWNACQADEPMAGRDTYDEGPTIYCTDCGATLQSSYGDPDAEQEG